MEIDRRLIAQIIQPRMEEIFEIAALEIKRSGYSRHLSGGVVLTGGGALIKGTADLAREVLGLPVKIGIPSGFSGGLVREIENPAYATAVGLVYHGLKHLDRAALTGARKRDRSVGEVFDKMKRWFDEL
jgi:cell division protein FtsA